MRVLLATACAAMAGMTLGEAGRMSTTTTVEDEIAVTECDQIRVRFNDAAALRAEEEISIPGSDRLQIDAAPNGGIHVQGWSEDHYLVKLCKAVPSGSKDRAREALGRIRLSDGEGRLSVSGLASGDWIAHLIVRAPASSEIIMKADNGGIGLHDVDGHVEARTENGPISVRGGSGDLSLETQNGPVEVSLAGTRWHGAGLEARTENGPVTLKVPRHFDSGLRVRASWHSPWSCRASQCDGARKRWDDDSHLFELGEDPVIRLSTVNGPVSIEPGERD